MVERLALIGFGEAAQAFAPDLSAAAVAYDRKTDSVATRDAKIADYAEAAIKWCPHADDALAGAAAALSLVTADQAVAAAEAAAKLPPGALWLDMNSVAPDTKCAAAHTIAARGGRYVDVAIMAPVHPGGVTTPLLVSGPHAEAGAAQLRTLGFGNVTVVAGPVGAASAIKMIRSVMIKGVEALSAECVLAAEAAGVRDQVIASLDASRRDTGWAERFDYNLDRMLVHGRRRVAEMKEVVATLDALGVGSAMSRATMERQAAIGSLSIAPPDGLDAKLAAIGPLLTTPARDRAA